MRNRTWINRSEIAEIHDAIADKETGVLVSDETDEMWNDRLDHHLDHKKRAQDIRDIEHVFPRFR